MNRRTLYVISAVFAVTQLAYDYFSAPVAFPYFKYVTLETASEVTKQWFQEAKEKRDRDKITEVAENAVIPVMPEKESGLGVLPDKRNVKDLP